MVFNFLKLKKLYIFLNSAFTDLSLFNILYYSNKYWHIFAIATPSNF